MTEYRCRNGSCRVWYLKHLGECPACGTPPNAFNKYLRTASLNNNLYSGLNAPDPSHAAAKGAAKDWIDSF